MAIDVDVWPWDQSGSFRWQAQARVRGDLINATAGSREQAEQFIADAANRVAEDARQALLALGMVPPLPKSFGRGDFTFVDLPLGDRV